MRTVRKVTTSGEADSATVPRSPVRRSLAVCRRLTYAVHVGVARPSLTGRRKNYFTEARIQQPIYLDFLFPPRTPEFESKHRYYSLFRC